MTGKTIRLPSDTHSRFEALRSNTNVSKVSGLNSTQEYESLVFNNLRDLRNALRAFGSEPNSEQTERIVREIMKTSVRNQREQASLYPKGLEGLRNDVIYYNHFKGDAAGTGFENGGVGVSRIDNKYVLTLSIYPEAREKALKESTGAHRALTSASIDVTFDHIGGIFFNIDLAQFGKAIGAKGNMINVSEGFVADPEARQSVRFVHNKRGLTAGLYLFDIPETNDMPDGERYDGTHMIASSGSRVFGIVNAAIGPEPGTINIHPPSMTITFETENQTNGSTMIADRNVINDIISARDQIADRIREMAGLSRK